MTVDELKERARALPHRPGVYIMMDSASTVIYVGKAKVLKNRVSQYFQDSVSHTEKTRNMVAQIDHFDVIVADSEFEALVLECALIKRHMPRYNILLKDDKGYPYIRLTVKALYPKFSIAGRVATDGARYFGPFGSRKSTWGILDALQVALKLPTCHRQFPRDIGKTRPCLNYHMGRCAGYCRPEMTLTHHKETIAQAIRLLEGKFGEVEQELRKAMEEASEELRFEEAAQIRDRLRAIELLGKRQKVVAGSLVDTDVVGFYHSGVKGCFVVLRYIEGELAAKDWELVPSSADEDWDEMLAALVKQYYTKQTNLPRQILLPWEFEEGHLLARMLTEEAGYRVEVVTPQRGAKVDLIRLANTNAKEEVERATTREERQNKLLDSLGKLLLLPQPPRRIESFDISNTGGSDMVASMVVFWDGRPKKSDYRHFHIKTLTGPDDYGAMEEVLTRRFRRYLAGDERFNQLPDLLLIDGGVTHSGVALRVLRNLGLSIPVFGMVKDDRHRTRAIVTPEGHEIGLGQNQGVFALVGQIQEETHRFAITFHRKQRSQRMKGSQLDEIPGVGQVRRNALLKAFHSVKKIKEATVEELSQAVPTKTAQAIYDFYHTKED